MPGSQYSSIGVYARSVFHLVVAVLLLPVAQAQDKSAWDWLEQLSRQHRTQNYAGVLSFQRDDELHSLHVVHSVFGDQEFERLDYLDGENRQIVRRAHNVYCIHPGHRLRGVGGMLLTQQALESGRLKQSYTAKLDGVGRIGGRDTVSLTLIPHDTNRFAQHLSIDRDSGLLVKSEIIGEQQQVLERIQFADLEVGGQYSQSLFDLDDKAVELHHPSAEQRKDLGFSWRVGWLPDGFVLTSENEKKQLQVMSFTDGLAAVSVFVESLPDNADGEGGVRNGATVAYARVLADGNALYQVTAVGEVPETTVKRIVESVSLGAGTTQ